jgi:diguanylate cyclase (GGDEF)-like protein/putative nucleotidyltransferase with HDIG domain
MKTNIGPTNLFWNKILQIGFVFVPVFLLRFSYVLTNDSKGKLIIKLGYFFAIIIIALTFMNLIVTSAGITETGRFFYEINKSGAYTLAVFGSFYSLVALFIMIRKTVQKEVSFRTVGLVIVGLSLVIIGGALNLNTRIGAYGIDILFNTINAVLITFAIYRNKFLEINIIVKRGISATFYNIFMFVIYATVIVFSYNILEGELNITSDFMVILVMVPIFFLIEPLRVWFQKLTSHIFYKRTNSRQIVLKEFSELINTSLDLDVITHRLIKAIEEALDVEEVNILLTDDTKYAMRDSSDVLKDKEDYFFKLNHPVVRWFNKGEKLLLKTQIENHIMFKGLWDVEKKIIKQMKTEIISPIMYSEELVGVVIISGRQDGTPYSFEETDFLHTLINTAAAIIENAKTIELIQKQSITDELTKFYNHRYFYDTTNDWIKERRYTSFGLAIIDIDQFKIYNDLYGHASGDLALKRIANLIKQATSPNEMLVRFGGEEFIVLFPNLNPEDVFEKSEYIRETVEREFLLSKDIREFLTVTVGISNYVVNGESLEELITKADNAVLQGKQSGRNRTIVYFEENETKNDRNTQVQQKIKEAFISSIYALAATIDAKDHYTYGHSNNVAVLSEAIARKAGYSEKQIETVKNAGLLHDIGKVGIPESVLSKPGFLTPDEYETMQGHVIQSINIIKHIPNLIDTVPIVISHHERYDGKGYPRGIKGENIPILGRVICIADSFDAMTTDRPYRKGLSLEEAINELKVNSGKQFDPALVEVFLDIAHNDELLTLNLQNRPSFN